MPRGGARRGAGRKPGSLSRKTREIAERASTEGITPLEVMLRAMRHYFDAGDLTRAAAIAKDAAPFCHPRLSAVEHSGVTQGPSQVDMDDARERILARLNSMARNAMAESDDDEHPSAH